MIRYRQGPEYHFVKRFFKYLKNLNVSFLSCLFSVMTDFCDSLFKYFFFSYLLYKIFTLKKFIHSFKKKGIVII